MSADRVHGHVWGPGPGAWLGTRSRGAKSDCPAGVSLQGYARGVPRYATVYPLVSTRALARPFTYELTNGAAKGAVVSVPLGRSRRRGVVVELVDEAPAGVEPVPIDSVLGEPPPGLVDPALWGADHYGSTPRRALSPSPPRPQ